VKFPLPQTLLARIEGDHARLVDALPLLAQLSAYAANYSPDNDGYPAGGSSGARTSDTTSTTERAALNGCSTAEMERMVEGFLAGTTLILNAASRLGAYVTPRQVEQKRVNTVEMCPGCDKPMPKVKSGFCPACYQQWAIREQRPDRAWFIRRRKAERDQAAAREAEQAKAARAGNGAP
jgi:hypothetical protein